MSELPPIQSFEEFEKVTLSLAMPFKSQFAATWFHEIGKQRPQRDWLVKNLILAKTFGIVYGPPGCGKSFLVSDLMLTCAAGTLLPQGQRPEWFRYKARPFGVVYVVAEGRDDFEIRLHAWRKDHDIPLDAVIPFVFLPTSIDLRSNDADAKKLANEIKGLSALMEEKCGVGVGCVVLDTVARSLAGGNENDSHVMGAFVINCGRLQEHVGVTVVGIHHGGKEVGRGPRGHEALHGAADFEIEVAGATADSPNTWTVRKLKAGPGGAMHRFRLRQTTLGEDSEGDPVTSCVVVPPSATDDKAKEKKKGWRVGQGEREFLDALAEAVDRHGVMPPSDLPLKSHIALLARVDDVRRIYTEKFSATETGTEEQIEARLRQRWSRASKKVVDWKLVGSKKPWLWFTGKPIQDFRLRGIVDTVPTYVEPPDDPAALPPSANDELPEIPE